MIDPAPLDFQLTTPTLPFIVSIPAPSIPLPLASVATDPFSLTHPNITLNISGTVLPLPADATQPLSSFLTNYLSGLSNPITISSPLFGISVDTIFPAPSPRPHLLQNVTIKEMKIKPGNTFLASGTVFARLVLPKGLNVGINVSLVLPDVLVFDGEIDEIQPVPPPLPDPLPERAFGRIRPGDWIASVCEPDESQDGEGSAYSIWAKIVDVPLEVLPGREKEFSNFISKVSLTFTALKPALSDFV